MRRQAQAEIGFDQLELHQARTVRRRHDVDARVRDRPWHGLERVRSQQLFAGTRLVALLAEAVADAAQRVLSGKWADEGTGLTATSKPVAKKSAPRKAGATRKAPAAKAAATRKPAAKKSAAKKPAARKSSSPAKRRSSSGARKRATARPKAPPQS